MTTIKNANFDLYNTIVLAITDWIDNDDDDRTNQDMIDWASTLGVILTVDDIQQIVWDLDEM